MTFLQLLSIILSIETSASENELERASKTITKMVIHHLVIFQASYSIGIGEQLMIVKEYVKFNYAEVLEIFNFVGN